MPKMNDAKRTLAISLSISRNEVFTKTFLTDIQKQNIIQYINRSNSMENFIDLSNYD